MRGTLTRTEEIRNECKNLILKPEGKRPPDIPRSILRMILKFFLGK